MSSVLGPSRPLGDPMTALVVDGTEGSTVRGDETALSESVVG
jgi:hypothetical protein